jgi:hypothetical protein
MSRAPGGSFPTPDALTTIVLVMVVVPLLLLHRLRARLAR